MRVRIPPVKSPVVYYAVLNAHADKPETIKHVIDLLDTEFHKTGELEHFLLVGDAKSYQLMYEVKNRYPGKYDFIIPFIGDFHILVNFQPVIMKIFWDGGLMQLAELLHCGARFTALHSCSNYRRMKLSFFMCGRLCFAFRLTTFLYIVQQQIPSFFLRQPKQWRDMCWTLYKL
jgi:hypothetical protein